MKPLPTTVTLAAFALASLIIAIAVHYGTQPVADQQTELIDEYFFPEFLDPSEAATLKLTIWDPEERNVAEFKIEKKDDLWRLSNFEDYPVESSEQLIATAGSAVRIRRERLAGKSSETHEQFGVVNPEDATNNLREAKAIGDRITILNQSGNVVCDLIVGNAVEEEASNTESNQRERVQGKKYYVRQADEEVTYVASLNLNISTELEDWIDSDLLQMGTASVEKLQLKNYEIAAKAVPRLGGRRAPVRDKYEELVFEKEAGSWKLEGLDDATKQVKQQPVNELTNSFSQLKIINVEPKPTYEGSDAKVLNPDLSVNLPPGVDPESSDMINRQVSEMLGAKGFILGLTDVDNLSNPVLLSENGEMTFATDAGLVYHLVFGADVKMTGNKFEFSGSEEESAEKSGEGDDEKSVKGESKEQKEDKESEQTRNGKIMSVHVTFDESLIEKPTEPFKPVRPEPPVADPPKKSEENPMPPVGDGEKSGPEAKKEDGKDPKSESDEPKKAEPPKSVPPAGIESEKGKEAEKSVEPKSADEKPADEKSTPKKDAEKSDDSGSCGSDEFLIQEKSKDLKSEDPESADPKSDNSKPSDSAAKQDPEPETKQDAAKQDPEKKEAVPADNTKKEDAKNEAAKQEDAKQDEKSKVDGQGNDSANPDPQEPAQNEGPSPEFIKKLQEYRQALLQFEQDQQQYNDDMEQYQKDVEAYEKTVKENKLKTENLNKRFADWFYIIEADDTAKFKLTREQAIEPKPAADPAGGNPLGGGLPPNLPPNLNIPGLTPPPANVGNPESPQKKEESESGKGTDAPPTKAPEKQSEPAKEDPKADSTKSEPKPESKPETKPDSEPANPKKEPAPAEDSKKAVPESEKKAATDSEKGESKTDAAKGADASKENDSAGQASGK